MANRNDFLNSLKIESTISFSGLKDESKRIINNLLSEEYQHFPEDRYIYFDDKEALKLFYILLDEKEELYKKVKSEETYEKRFYDINYILKNYRDKTSEEYKLAEALQLLKDPDKVFELANSLMNYAQLSRDSMQKVAPLLFNIFDTKFKGYRHVLKYFENFREIVEAFKNLRNYYIENDLEAINDVISSLYWFFQVGKAHKEVNRQYKLFALKELEKAFLKDAYRRNREHIYMLSLIYKEIAEVYNNFDNNLEAYIYFNKAYNGLYYLKKFLSLEKEELKFLEKRIEDLKRKISEQTPEDELLKYDAINKLNLNLKDRQVVISNYLKEANKVIKSNPALATYYIDLANDLIEQKVSNYVLLGEIAYLYYLTHKLSNQDERIEKKDILLRGYKFLYKADLEKTNSDIYSYLELFSKVLKECFELKLFDRIQFFYPKTFEKLEKYSNQLLQERPFDVRALKLVVDNLVTINNYPSNSKEKVSYEERFRYAEIAKLYRRILVYEPTLENFIEQFKLISHIAQTFYRRGPEEEAPAYFKTSRELYKNIEKSFSEKEIEEALANIWESLKYEDKKLSIAPLKNDYFVNIFWETRNLNFLSRSLRSTIDVNMEFIRLQQESLNQGDTSYYVIIWEILKNIIMKASIYDMDSERRWAAEKFYELYMHIKPKLDEPLDAQAIYLYEALKVLLQSCSQDNKKALLEYKDTLVEITNYGVNLSEKWIENGKIEKKEKNYIGAVLESLLVLDDYYVSLKMRKEHNDTVHLVEKLFKKLDKIENFEDYLVDYYNRAIKKAKSVLI